MATMRFSADEDPALFKEMKSMVLPGGFRVVGGEVRPEQHRSAEINDGSGFKSFLPTNVTWRGLLEIVYTGEESELEKLREEVKCLRGLVSDHSILAAEEAGY